MLPAGLTPTQKGLVDISGPSVLVCMQELTKQAKKLGEAELKRRLVMLKEECVPDDGVTKTADAEEDVEEKEEEEGPTATVQEVDSDASPPTREARVGDGPRTLADREAALWRWCVIYTCLPCPACGLIGAVVLCALDSRTRRTRRRASWTSSCRA